MLRAAPREGLSSTRADRGRWVRVSGHADRRRHSDRGPNLRILKLPIRFTSLRSCELVDHLVEVFVEAEMALTGALDEPCVGDVVS